MAVATGLPDSKVGTFTPALYDEAKKNGWNVISMKNDGGASSRSSSSTADDITFAPPARPGARNVMAICSIVFTIWTLNDD